MALVITHPFQSAKGDGVDPTLVQPSNWNATHTMAMATARLLGRTTAGTGTVEELTSLAVATFLLGDIQTALGLGALATKSTILTADVTAKQITNALLADVATATFKGRTTAATGSPEDLTVTQATALLAAFIADTGVAVGVKGLVPSSSIGDAAARKFLMASGAWVAPSLAPDIILEEQQVSGTDGGTFTSGADRTRILNQEVRDAYNLCTLGSNQFILLAGSYYVEWSAPATGDSAGGLIHQSMLYDVTGAAVLKRGQQMGTDGAATQITNPSCGQHVFTIAASNTFEIRHRTNLTTGTKGLGRAGGFGTEIYTVVKIWKIA